MPAKSKKQERFMQAVAHSPKFAKKVGVSKAVAGKFVGPKAYKAECERQVAELEENSPRGE